MKRPDLHTRLSYALAWIRGRTDAQPRVGLILGSGLSAIADRLARPTAIPQDEIPEFPMTKVPGHPGRLVIGEMVREPGSVVVAAMLGRVHAYEGWSPEEVAFSVRVLHGLGVERLIVTNASGGIDPSLEPGDLVRIVDHINLSGRNPLVGENDDRLGPRFPDLSQAYDPRLGKMLCACANRLGIDLKSGVYAYVLGPSYETPAEVRMLRTLGADCVGMSTVPEVIAARHMGLPVCGISVITNRASGLSDKALSHAEVEETAKRAKGSLGALLAELILESAQ